MSDAEERALQTGRGDGRRRERSAVVKWLRECAALTQLGAVVEATYATAADAIEIGAHDEAAQ